MALRGRGLAYLLCLFSFVPMAHADRARDVAECGFLAHIAVQQMKRRDVLPDQYDAVRRDVVAFVTLWHRMRGEADAVAGPIDASMLAEVAKTGRAAHARRISGMGAANALRLSNRVLRDCRSDIALLWLKEAE